MEQDGCAYMEPGKHGGSDKGIEATGNAEAVAGDAAGGVLPQDGESAQGCPCRHKATPRSQELQADIRKRLNRAIGQLNGVKAMIDDNRYCGDVLTQLAAAESAVRRVSEMVLAEHMRTCVVEEIRTGNDEVVDEAMALIRRFM